MSIINEMLVQFVMKNLTKNNTANLKIRNKKKIQIPQLIKNYNLLKQSEQNVSESNLTPLEIQNRYEQLAIFLDTTTQNIFSFIKENSQSITFNQDT